MTKTQQGFAVLEMLLILVVIAFIGGTGYYVWHSKSNADKNLNNAASTSIKAPSQSIKANTAYLNYPFSSITDVSYSAVPKTLQAAILKDYSQAPTCIKDGKPLGGGNDSNGPDVMYIPNKFAVVNIGCGIDSPPYLFVADSNSWQSIKFDSSDGSFLTCATLNKYRVPLTLIDKSAGSHDGDYDCNPKDGLVEPSSIRN